MTTRYRFSPRQGDLNLSFLVDNTVEAVIAADYVSNTPEAVSELEASVQTVAFSDAAKQQIAVNVTRSNSYSADLSSVVSAAVTTPSVTVSDGATVEITGVSSQSVRFAGTTGTLKLDDGLAFTGQVSGLTGSDAVDLADVSYGANTTATFSGNVNGGTLTVTDGTDTAHIALLGDYLKSGWTLSSDGNGGTIVVDPPLYPNATNTGVPAGVKLTPYSGTLTLSTPGQVVSGLIISDGVQIDASNVTLENCIIEIPNSGSWDVGVASGLTGVVIQNCEIVGSGLSGQVGTYGIYVQGDSQVTINADNIHDVGTGVIVSGGQTIVENSYIHNLNAGAGTHYNGVGYFGGGGSDFSLLVQNNTIINQNTQTDAVMIQNYFGAVNNVTVNSNLLVGGDYPIYVDGTQGSYPTTNVSVTNNDLGLGTGSFGYTDFNKTSPVFTGNVDDGATLAAALPVSPVVSEASAAAGNYSTGNTLTLTLYTSEAVTVSGTPTLTLNDGGTATYTGGTGTNALTFSYKVAAGQNTSALAVTAVNGTIADLDGNVLNSSNLPATFTGVSIGATTTAPTVLSVMESPASGDLNAGKTATLTLNLSEAVTLAGGTPTLTLNDGGTATYSGGSGTNSLTFSYTVAAGQNTADLAATTVNLNSATVKDGAGNAANLSLTGLTQNGPQIDTTTPIVTQVLASPANGTELVGDTITLTLDMNEAVKVTGTPTLALNDGGTATYTGGSGTNSLTFNYTIGATDSTVSALGITQANLPNGATITNLAGTAANLSGVVTTLSGLAIDPPPSTGYTDGSANAPVGNPQLPNLLSSYSVRPAWQVAGVDYAVGVPTNMTLKDPTVAANLPAGVSIDTTNHVIDITKNNVTLNGFDFSLHGGWGIVIEFWSNWDNH